MVSCKECWWADFNETAAGKHLIHEEPDYLQMKSAFANPPMVRVIKSCGKGREYFKTYGGSGQHNCGQFTEFAKEDKKEQAEVASKREKWDSPTQRERLPQTSNVFALIEKMYEGDNKAYEILIEAMALGENAIGWLILNLNDMNIRGGQIPLAYAHYSNEIAGLLAGAKARSKRMVAHVNSLYADADTERAVVRGAAQYGHKKATTKSEPKRAEVEVVSTGRIATKRLKLKR